MTQQPAQGPGRMPNPVADLRQDLGETLAVIRDQNELLGQALTSIDTRLARLVELTEASKAALDSMQGGEPDPFSVRGLGDAGPDEDTPPFIGS